MGVCGCLCGDADAYDLSMPDWMVWSDHPVRKQFDVVMDLGEGSFAQVTFRVPCFCSESIQVNCSVSNPLCISPGSAGQAKG